MLHSIKVNGLDFFYHTRLETSEKPHNSNNYTKAGIMKEPKPIAEQMRDRADELEKALEIKLWCWPRCGQPHTFQIGFDLNVIAYLSFRERDRQQDYARMKLALMKGIKTLQDKLKEVTEYEHHNKS